MGDDTAQGAQHGSGRASTFMPERSLRIAMVSPYDLDVPGGVQSHVRQLARLLQAHGDEVHVIAPGTSDRGTITTVGASLALPFNDSVAPIALDPRVVLRVRSRLAGKVGS